MRRWGSVLVVLLLAAEVDASDPIRVACLGDSITAGARLEPRESYPAQLQELLGDGYQVENFGRGGATLLRGGSPNVWQNLSRVDAFDPQVVIIALGTNDTVSGNRRNWERIDAFDDDYRDLVEHLRSLDGDPHVVICTPTSMLPQTPGLSDSRRANLLERRPRLQQLCRQIRALVDAFDSEQVSLLELNRVLEDHPEWVSDGVHPTAEGQAQIAQAVADHLQELGGVSDDE